MIDLQEQQLVLPVDKIKPGMFPGRKQQITESPAALRWFYYYIILFFFTRKSHEIEAVFGARPYQEAAYMS